LRAGNQNFEIVLLFFMAQQPLVGQGSSLFRLHVHIQLDTPRLAGHLWESDQLNAETST